MAGKPWTRDEALVAFNVYCRLPFGKLHARNPEIEHIAKLLSRSPASLAMKCCNFAALDPAQRERGISGLQKVGQIDRDLWAEFESNPEKVGFESEDAFAKISGRSVDEIATQPEVGTEIASTATARWEDVAGLDREAVVRVRVNQRFFRTMILASYDAACAVCGLPIPSLLVASHIIPWSMDNSLRMNPRNGICLCSLHDRAFDTGVMFVDNAYTIRLASLKASLRAVIPVAHFLVAYEGHTIRLPERWLPDPELLQRRIRVANCKVFD